MHRLARWLGILGIVAAFPAGSAPLKVEIEPEKGSSAVTLRLSGQVPGVGPQEIRLQRSLDLKSWSPTGIKVRVAASADAGRVLLSEEDSDQGFFRLSSRPTSFAASSGAETLGYDSSFADEIDALGVFTPTDFADRFGNQESYLPRISWDPTNSLYWADFQRDVVKVPPPGPGAMPFTVPALKLSNVELSYFRTNGFVVSERLGNDSFGDVFYDLFTRDLPVFISTDSILHAWHRSFDGVLQSVEEGHLRGQVRSMLLAMLGSIAAARNEYGSGVLKTSVDDAEYFLAVAAHLIALDGERPSPVPSDTARFNQTLQLILAGQPVTGFHFFDGRQNSEIVDFSQYKPRGHYTHSVALERYFQGLMWLGRVDLRVAGDTNFASSRQLGTAIVLNDLLDRSGSRTNWQKIDRLLTTIIGASDSMNFDHLGTLLAAAGVPSPKAINSPAILEFLRAQIEAGTLGTQLIQGHGFVAGLGDDQIKLPRSFAFLGQRFTVDSWALGQTVMDRILLPGSAPAKLVRRRLPYSLDVDFAVFGNNQVVPEIVANILNTSGEPFRDGFPYQRNLAAIRQVLDHRTEASWTATLYDRWLLALRTLSTPTTGPEFPEAMRTRAWAMKTVNTQLASWTQLRHDSVLYVKQSETGPILCLYPAGFVEPRPEFFLAMRGLAIQAAAALKEITLPPLPGGTAIFGPPTDRPRAEGPNQKPAEFFLRFGTNCNVLAGIATRELQQQPLSTNEVRFLKDTIEQVSTYFGDRQYNGWYPQMYYWGTLGNGGLGRSAAPNNRPNDHDCVFPDFLVADVHTDGPSVPDGDPGAVLHEGVGRVNLLMIAVDNGPDRMVFAGPVMSHYEFTKPYGVRLTDEEWKTDLKAGRVPSRPPWTRSYLVPNP